MANQRFTCWYDILAENEPIVAYLSDAKNGIADTLSRKSDLKSPKTKEFHDLLVPRFNETSCQLHVTEIWPIGDLVKTNIKNYKDKVIEKIRRVVKKRSDNSVT